MKIAVLRKIRAKSEIIQAAVHWRALASDKGVLG
jgi:hypothetical protein